MAKNKDIELKIRPLDDCVVVEPLEAETKMTGGILLPDSAKEKPQRGRVIAVGPGKLHDNGQRSALPVKKGDEVIYGRYAGNDIEVDGKEIKIMRESDILAKEVIEERAVRVPGHMRESDILAKEVIKESGLEQNALKDLRKTPRAWLYSEQFLAAVPTALLVGMYAAAAFSFWSVGPLWVGFLLGAVPIVGLALWAFAGPSSEVSG